MKVCILPAAYKPIPPVKGGAVETIVQNFIELNEIYHDFDFTVLSIYDADAEKKSNELKYTKTVYFNGMERLDKKYYWCIYKVLKKFFNIILPDYILRNNMVNYINKYQDEFDWILVEAGEIDCFRYYCKKIDPSKIVYHSHGEIRNEKKLDDSLKYYIAVSDFIRDTWHNTTNWEDYRSITLKNGIDQSKFKTNISDNVRNENRSKFGFSSNDIVLVYVGRIIQEKGVKELLEVMYMLPNNYKLLVIGSANFGTKTSTPYEKNVTKMIDNLGNRVTFTGFISNENLGMYYNMGDISIVPSIFEDPAPLVVIEAMAAGLPLVTTGSGGIGEYCDTECARFVKRDNGLIDNMAKEILALGNDKEIRVKMSNASKEVSKLYTMEAQYENLVEIFSKLIGQ